MPRILLFLFSIALFSECHNHAPRSENKLPFDSLFEARAHGKWGWIDRSGKVVIPFVFDSILRYENGNCFVIFDGKTGLIDSSARFIIRPLYEDLWSTYGDSLYHAKMNGKCGLIRRDETVLVPFKYETIYSANDPGDSIFIAGDHDKLGLVSKHDRRITPFIFENFSLWWRCGALCCKQGSRWGYVTVDGKFTVSDFRSEDETYTALECVDDTVRYDASCGRVCVYIKALGKYGYMDARGHWAVEPKYEYALPFSEMLAVVSEDNKRYYFIDTAGKKVLGDFSDAQTFTHGVAVVNVDSLIDKTGKLIAISRWPIWRFDEQYNMFKLDARNDDFAEGQWGLMNLQGKLVVDPWFYHDFSIPSEGMIAVCEKIEDTGDVTSAHGHRWGFIDTSGHEIVPCQYEVEYLNSDFHNGLAPVVIDGKYGYIGKSGAVAIPGVFAYAENFNHGLALVYIGKKMSYIDPKGNVIWQEP